MRSGDSHPLPMDSARDTFPFSVCPQQMSSFSQRVCSCGSVAKKLPLGDRPHELLGIGVFVRIVVSRVLVPWEGTKRRDRSDLFEFLVVRIFVIGRSSRVWRRGLFDVL